MRYDIVPIESCYRGIERSLTTLHLNSYKAKTNFDYVLNQYFDYLKVLEQPCSKKNFCEIMDFYHIFLDYNILCELIVWEERPLDNVYENELEFLGIDVVCDMSESLIVSYNFQGDLNCNGLYNNECEIYDVLKNYGGNMHEWKPCWVYTVQC